ncbi:MAG: PPC domain-containing protein [Spirochaeta sp.]|nr:PPC domain-containing protein [Spirochaeta sp.]
MKMRLAMVLFFIVVVGVALNANEQLLWSNATLGDRTQESSYDLVVPATGLLSIEAVSLSFSPRLLLIGPDGASFQGEYNPRSATISAFVVEPGQYTVSISAPLGFLSENDSAEGHGQYLLMADMVAPAATLQEGQPQNRQLTAEAPLIQAKTYVNWYRYVLPESGRALLQLQSREFDTALTVYYADGTQDFNDDYNDSTDSGLRVQGEPGSQIFVGATSFASGSTGAYSLTAEELAVPVGVGTYQPNMLLEKPGEYSFELGNTEHTFQVQLEAGERLEVLMESDDFDSYLELSGPDGNDWSDDDGGGNLNALLAMTAQTGGVYELTARRFGLSGALGFYTLTLAEPPLLESIFRSTETFSGEPVSVGMDFEAGSTFTVEVGSTDFDTILTLYDPKGAYIFEDDDGGEGTNSRLRFSTSHSGTYTVEVKSYGGSEEGEFDIEVFQHQD